MKKTILSTVLMAFAFIFANAQNWNSPTYKAEMPVSGTAYYVYNVGAKGFLNRGGDWGAHAAISAAPRANASVNYVTWTMDSPSAGVYTFAYTNNGTTDATHMFHAGDWDVWGDGGGAARTDINWLIAETDPTLHIVSIQNDAFAGQDKYLGWSGYVQTTNKGKADEVFTDKAMGSDHVKWMFVSQANLDLYKAKVILNRYMLYAKAKGGIDLTSYITTYNADQTADITAASASLLTELGREDVSSQIVNASFETALGSEWTNTGGFVRQSNSSGQGWTKDLTNYCEKYTGSVGYLAAGALVQTVSVPNGIYGLVVSGHAVQQAGANPLHTGAFISAGNQKTEIIAGNDYFVDTIKVTTGSITLGYSLEGDVQANWIGFDNFRLYKYVTFSTPALSASVSTLRFDDLSKSSTVNVTANFLSSDIAITAPAGITLSGSGLIDNGNGSYTIALANANSTHSITIVYDGSSPVNGTISFGGSGSGNQTVSASISVKASTNAGCFNPAYSTGNMIADPTFSAATLSEGGYGGWGPVSIDTKNPYCGKGSAFIRGTCWPNGGSMDRSLNAANGNALKANTHYRLRAMINSQATVGTNFQFQVEGYNGSTSIVFDLPKTTGWEQFDTTFVTGATTTEHGIYFNSCGANSPLITDTCFIDNYEMYAVPKFYLKDTVYEFRHFSQIVKMPVRGENLPAAITVSASAGFSVSPSSLLSAQAGDSVTVMFTGSATTSGYVYFSSGDVKDSVAVSATIEGSVTSLSRLNVNATKLYKLNAEIIAEFEMIKAGPVRISVYDMQGKVLATVVRNAVSGSNKQVIADQFGQPMYIVKIQTEGQNVVNKVF